MRRSLPLKHTRPERISPDRIPSSRTRPGDSLSSTSIWSVELARVGLEVHQGLMCYTQVRLAFQGSFGTRGRQRIVYRGASRGSTLDVAVERVCIRDASKLDACERPDEEGQRAYPQLESESSSPLQRAVASLLTTPVLVLALSHIWSESCLFLNLHPAAPLCSLSEALSLLRRRRWRIAEFVTRNADARSRVGVCRALSACLQSSGLGS